MTPRFVFPPDTPLFNVVRAEPPEHQFEAHAVAVCDLGAGEKAYVLRVWNELLYFAEHPQRASWPVWTTFEPVPRDVQSDTSRLVSWWRGEVAAERFGVLDATPQFAAMLGLTVVWGCRGRGFLRPWWDPSGGEEFSWPNCEASTPVSLLTASGREPADAVLWEARWQNLNPWGEDNRNFSPEENAEWDATPRLQVGADERILARRPSPRLRKNHALTWRRGSRAECVALATAIFHLEEKLWRKYPTGEGRVRSRTRNDGSVVQFDMPQDWHPPRGYPEFRTRAYLLLDLLMADFDPLGWKWKREASWLICKWLSFSFPLHAPLPTEEIEAFILVRQWLDDLVSRGDLEAGDADLLIDWPFAETSSAEFHARVLARFSPALFDS